MINQKWRQNRNRLFYNKKCWKKSSLALYISVFTWKPNRFKCVKCVTWTRGATIIFYAEEKAHLVIKLINNTFLRFRTLKRWVKSAPKHANHVEESVDQATGMLKRRSENRWLPMGIGTCPTTWKTSWPCSTSCHKEPSTGWWREIPEQVILADLWNTVTLVAIQRVIICQASIKECKFEQ